MKVLVRIVSLLALIIGFMTTNSVLEASETVKGLQIKSDDCDKKRGRKKKDCREDSNSNSNNNRNSNSNDNRNSGNSNSNRNSSNSRISLSEARKIALERVPGNIIKEEFERENGRAIYEIYIRKNNGEVYEIYVDAANGNVLKIENKSDDD